MPQERVNITVRIKGVQPFTMKVEPVKEESARKAIDIINHLIDSWKDQFPNLEPIDLLGRIALRTAWEFEILNEREESLRKMLEENEKAIDNLLLELDPPATR